MKISMNQATMMKTPMDKFLRAISEAGFDGVELRRDETFAYLEEHSVKDLSELLEQNDLEVVSWNAIELFSLCPQKEFEWMLDYSERLMKIGNEIGCDLIIAVPSFTDDAIVEKEQYEDLTVRRFQTLRKLADDYEFRMGFEPLGFPNNSVRNVKKAVRIMEKAEEDGLDPSGLVIDTFHYFLAHTSPQTLKDIPEDRLWLVHCNDAIKKPLDELQDEDRVHMGDGFFELEEFFGVLRDIDCDKYLSVEMFNQDYWNQDPREVARKSMEHLKKFL